VTPRRVTVGIDGGNCTGLAVGVNGRIVEAAAANPDGKGFDLAHVLSMVAQPGDELRAIVEIPDRLKRLPSGKTVPIRNIVTLSITIGRWVERAVDAGCSIVQVVPQAWKGRLRKDAMTERIRGRLSPDELALLAALELPPSKEHNVLDAIGLVLWASGRLERKYRK
jgi:hypothetical protein